MQHQLKISDGDKQIRYRLYMQANNLEVGDLHDLNGFMLWVGKHLRAFMESHGLVSDDSLTTNGLQDEFTDYLSECADVEQIEVIGQTNIFDFIGGN